MAKNDVPSGLDSGAHRKCPAARRSPACFGGFVFVLGFCFALAALARAQTTVRSFGEVVLGESSEDKVQTQKAIDRAFSYLGKQQRTNGGVGLSSYEVATTALTGMAILGTGVQPDEVGYGRVLSRCLDHILERGDKDDFLSEFGPSSDSGSRMHGHCYAVLFLTQVLGSLPLPREERVQALIRRGVSVIEGAQSREGGWWYHKRNPDNQDEASVTVCALQALRAADEVGVGVDTRCIDRAVAYVKSCQNQRDGSFRYSISMDQRRTTLALTAAAVSTLNAAGVYESPELRRGLDCLQRNLAAYRRNPAAAIEKEWFFYGNLYMAQALFQQGGEAWKDWYPKVRSQLLSRQAADGSWESPYGNEYATATAVLILEIPLGYLPLFQR